jgi:hypothetical protein
MTEAFVARCDLYGGMMVNVPLLATLTLVRVFSDTVQLDVFLALSSLALVKVGQQNFNRGSHAILHCAALDMSILPKVVVKQTTSDVNSQLKPRWKTRGDHTWTCLNHKTLKKSKCSTHLKNPLAIWRTQRTRN